MQNKTFFTLGALSLGFCIMIAGIGSAYAHCDSYDGPVIKDAQLALNLNDVTPVLKWVAPKDEAAIKALFTQIVAIRNKGEDIQKIADIYFFESLVRIHRTGEGAGFRGLKPAGSISPALAGADKALETGDMDQFAEKIAATVRKGIKSRFTEAYERKKTADKTVQQGRDYVTSYVQFIHFVEEIHQLVSHGATHDH